MFRHSVLTGLIDNTDSSILSNVTNVAMYKYITPTLNEGLKYTLRFK